MNARDRALAPSSTPSHPAATACHRQVSSASTGASSPKVRRSGGPSLLAQLNLLVRVMETRVGNLLVGGGAGRACPSPRWTSLSAKPSCAPLGDQPPAAQADRLPGPQAPDAPADLRNRRLALACRLRLRSRHARPTEPERPAVRTPAAGEVVDADVVVIGSGPAGSMARPPSPAPAGASSCSRRRPGRGRDRLGGPELDGMGDLSSTAAWPRTSDRWILHPCRFGCRGRLCRLLEHLAPGAGVRARGVAGGGDRRTTWMRTTARGARHPRHA